MRDRTIKTTLSKIHRKNLIGEKEKRKNKYNSLKLNNLKVDKLLLLLIPLFFLHLGRIIF